MTVNTGRFTSSHPAQPDQALPIPRSQHLLCRAAGPIAKRTAHTQDAAPMRIACPSCNAAYDVPDGVVAAGRTLRCSRCATDFVARAPDHPPAPPPADPPSPAVRDAALEVRDAERLGATPPAVPISAQPARLVLAAWALSIAVIGGAAWAAIAWRAPIMQAWPPSTRAYAALGYPQ